MEQPPLEDNILYTMPHTNYGVMDQTMETNIGIMDQHLQDSSTSASPLAGSDQGAAVHGKTIQRNRRKQKKQGKKLLGIGGQFKNNDMVTTPPQHIVGSFIVMD